MRDISRGLCITLFYLFLASGLISLFMLLSPANRMLGVYTFISSLCGAAFFSALYVFVCYIDKKLTKMEQEENKTKEQQDK